MFNWMRPRVIVEAARRRLGWFAAGEVVERVRSAPGVTRAQMLIDRARESSPMVATVGTMDDSGDCATTIKGAYSLGRPHVSDAVLGFFMGQGFIGHQICAFIAQNWLVDKCCSMPARDAIRQGYTVVNDEGGDLDIKVTQAIAKADRRHGINRQMREFIHQGRVFGIRIAIFKVESDDPNYYSQPFNPDGVTPGSYKGIAQVDPYWMAPELDAAAANDPASIHFYEPTWWRIQGKRYHRSHLVIMRNGEVPDLLRPVYMYGGKSVPQLIMERVYCAERTANEAPQLAMTKRATVFGTDIEAAMMDEEKFNTRLRAWVDYLNNYAIKVMDKEGDSMAQFDTSLADLDAVIMSQYQLVAAAANVPATKLLGTTPKGFNSSGEYEESSYHEELESIQAHDLTPFLERHHLLVMRSEVMPKLGLERPPETSVLWAPLDSPTAAEQAATNLAKAQRDAALVTTGAIDATDVRDRLRKDRDGDYHGIEGDVDPLVELPPDEPDPLGGMLPAAP